MKRLLLVSAANVARLFVDVQQIVPPRHSGTVDIATLTITEYFYLELSLR